MRTVDLRRWAAPLAGLALCLAACRGAPPCDASSACAAGTTCGLDGRCAPPPEPDAARFVSLRSLPVLAAEGAVGPEGASLCFGPDAPLTLDFGPEPPGVIAAELRLAPAPAAAPTAEAVIELRRGRARASLAYRAGAGRPLLADVSALLGGEGSPMRLSLRASAPVCVAPPGADALEAAPRLSVSTR